MTPPSAKPSRQPENEPIGSREWSMQTISVEPLNGGWAVKAAVAENEMVFRSGHDAETAARALAERLARQGEPVKLKLRLRYADKTVRMVALPPLRDEEPVRLIELPTPLIDDRT